MVLTYHGVSVDPPTLNTWLKNYKDDEGKFTGFSKSGGVNGYAVAEYAISCGVNITYDRDATGDLERMICGFGPSLSE